MYHLIDYVWCVEKFSQYFEPHEQEVYPLLMSPIFAYKNTRWVLNLYPEGLGDSASQGYISLFIKYVSEDPETINAKVELSLLNNKNERVYCRDTGDHQYQTFIDFGYKQFLKIQDIKDQKEDLIFNGQLKIFARVEFEHATLPSSLTWSNYDLLLFKENFKDLYETKNLCDIIIKIIKKPENNQQTMSCRNSLNSPSSLIASSNSQSASPIQSQLSHSNNNHHHYHPYNQINSLLSNHPHYSKTKRIGSSTKSGNSLTTTFNNNNSYLSDSDTSQNNSLSDFLSPSSPFSSQNSEPNESLLLSRLANNKTDNEFETLEIKAHKFILASRSGKFRELLKTNLIKICSLNNRTVPVTSCDQCLKSKTSISDRTTTNNTSVVATAFAGCPSASCLYKSKFLDFNSPGELPTNASKPTYINNNNNSGASSTTEASEILCSSSYPSCSTTSSSSASASSNQDQCTCCTCPKSNNSTLSSEPSSSFLSSSSNQEQPVCHIHNPPASINPNNMTMNKSQLIDHCPHETHKSQVANKLQFNSEDSDISDLLVIETDRNPKVIEYLIRYMYTGYLDSLDTFSKDIYEISKEYKVHGLTNLAREYIIKELNVHNCCDYLIFCVINNDYELNNKIQVFITENYDTIIKTNSYKQAKRKYRELFENTFNEISKKIPTLNKVHY